jgi:hypothetical protein
MVSALDPTKPIDGVPASKADLRNNLQTAKDEIEALQSGKTDLGHQHGLVDITDAGALAGLNVAAGDAQTAPSPEDSISTVTLNGSTDTVVLSEPATELRIVAPVSSQNLDVYNNSGGAIDVADAIGVIIRAGVPHRHVSRLEWTGVAWVHKVDLAASQHMHPSSNLSDSTAAGRALLTAADAAAQRTLLGVPTAFDPVETASTAITISDSVADQDLISTAPGAVTVTLGNATSDNKFGAITEGAREITVQVEANVEYYLETDDKTAAGRTASFKVRGSISWQVFRIDAGNRRYLIKGATDHEQNLRGQVISGYRGKKYSLSGAQTLSSANFLASATLANSGAAATWTLPSRVGPANTGYTEHLVVHNRGSGTLTLSASGVTLKGSTSIAANARATIEWEADGTTEYVWVRAT